MKFKDKNSSKNKEKYNQDVDQSNQEEIFENTSNDGKNFRQDANANSNTDNNVNADLNDNQNVNSSNYNNMNGVNQNSHNVHSTHPNVNHINNGEVKIQNNKEVERLHREIEELKKIISQNNLRIKELETQLNKFNTDYKNELVAKEKIAQEKIELKIKEYQEKFDKDLAHFKKYALKDKAIDLINIISNFEAAVSSEVKDSAVANYLKGFQMFCSMFKNYLESNNIREIVVNVNDDFNEKIMYAFESKKEENLPPNKVIKVIKKGYMLHDVVLEPAVVIVSK